MKPIKQSELFNAIATSWAGLSAEGGSTQAGESELPELRALNVLLAEDSVVNQKVTVGLLEKYGHSGPSRR